MSDRRAQQLAIKTFLDSREYFSDAAMPTPRPIPVVTQYHMQSEALLAEAVAKDAGLCVFIHVVAASVKHPNVEGPCYDPALIGISVYANPDVNESPLGLQLPAVEVADAIARLIQANPIPDFGQMWVISNRPAPDDEYERHDVVIGSVLTLSPDEPRRVRFVTDDAGVAVTDDAGALPTD
jgi:hypothetical protein